MIYADYRFLCVFITLFEIVYGWASKWLVACCFSYARSVARVMRTSSILLPSL